MSNLIATLPPIAADIKLLIERSKQNVAVAINSEITLLYWSVGARINSEILNNNRAEYGKQIVVSLSVQLTEEYGRLWAEKHLWLCIQFAEIFPDKKIVVALRRQLSWTHLRRLIPIQDPLKREFYIEMCKLEKWSSRQLQERIQAMLYERTAISKRPEKTILHDLKQLHTTQKLSPDLVFRDPYFLDFLGLADSYSEKDLETSIIAELQKFIIEFASDFALWRDKKGSLSTTAIIISICFFIIGD